MRTGREREKRQAARQSGNLRALRGRRASGILLLALCITLLLSSSFPQIARAALGTISLTLTETHNRDGTPGNGTVDFGTVYPGSTVVISPAVVFEVSSDLEWRLKAFTGVLPPGCTLKEAAQGSGLWKTLSPAPSTVRDSQPPCSTIEQAEDLCLTVSWTTPPGTYSVRIDYEAEFTDQTPPSGQVLINGGDSYTSSASVTLDLSAADDSGVVDAAAVSDDGLTWSDWQDYAASMPWVLTGDDGTKTVWVKFRDRAGNESEAVSDSIVLDRVPPEIGPVTVANRTASSADVSWTIDDPTAVSQVEYWVTLPASVEPDPAAPVTAAHLTGLTGGTGYLYRVVSTDPAGNQSASPEATFWTKCEPPSTMVDAEWHGNRVELTLTWSAPAGATGFNVYRSAETFTELPLPEPPPEPPFAFWVYSEDTTEGPDTVSADYFLNGAGEESDTSNIAVAIGDGAPPVIVSGPQAAPEVSTCEITWQTDEPSTSQVLYGTTPGNYTFSTAPDTAVVTDHAVTLTGLQAGTTYYYVVLSTDVSGNEVQSTEFSFTTEAATGPSLWVFEIWPNWKHIGLEWDPWPGATEYRVYRVDTADPPALPPAPEPPPPPWNRLEVVSGTTYTDRNLGTTWSYTWVVMAYSDTGESIYTNTVTLSTP